MPYLYLIKCQAFYKIGVATNLEMRLASLQVGNPFPLEVVAHYEFDNPSAVEQSLHQKFSDKRKLGEWFMLAEQDLAILHQICELLGGRKEQSGMVVTEQDMENAELIGTANDDVPIEQKIEEMLAKGYRIERSGHGEYRGQYLLARPRGKNRNGAVQLGRVTPAAIAYLEQRPGKGNRNNHDY